MEDNEQISLSCSTDTGGDSDGDGDVPKKYINPEVGITFSTFEEAKFFYNNYAKQQGFGTKVKRSSRNRRTKEKVEFQFACAKEGFKRHKEGATYQRPDTRVGCNAHFKIKLTDVQKWKVVSFYPEHNHACSPSKSRRFRSHKHLEAGTKRRLELNSDAGIGMNKSFHSIVVDAKGHENVLFGQKEARNHVDKYKRSKIQDGDAHTMETYFIKMQQRNSNFFYRVDHDEERRLQSVFWVDARSRAAYGYFGDVVTFDTTFCTNRYDLKFAPFVGVNHHGQSILLGCGLLVDQTTESFVWLFRTWLEAMSGSLPNAIITDECKAMANAITQVFPNAHHRLCLWHIMRKISDKLGSLKDYKEIKRAMQKAVYNSLRINEFEDAWAAMVEKYKLQGNRWLIKMYNMRNKWVPVFFKEVFFVGMSTTQRSESMNAFFDGYVTQKSSLKEFVDRYEMALADQREKEDQADFQCFNSSPTLKTCYSFERQIAKIYTISMFGKFQEQCLGMTSCSKSVVGVDEHITTYEIKEKVWDEHDTLHIKTYEVKYIDGGVSCICDFFQHSGILCRHALYVLNEYVTDFPPDYILLRWRKDFKRSYVESRVAIHVEAQNPIQRYDVLYPYTLQILDEGVLSESKFKIVLDGLRDLHKKVLSQNKASCDKDIELLEVGSAELPEGKEKERPKLLNPLQAKQIRRQKRIQLPSEKNVKAKKRKESDKSSTTKALTTGRKKTTTNKESTQQCVEKVNEPSNNFNQASVNKEDDLCYNKNGIINSQVLGSQIQHGSQHQLVSQIQNMDGAYTNGVFGSHVLGSERQLASLIQSQNQRVSLHLLAYSNGVFGSNVVRSQAGYPSQRQFASRSQIMERDLGAYSNGVFGRHMVGSQVENGSHCQFPSRISPMDTFGNTMNGFYTNLLVGSGSEQPVMGDTFGGSTSQERNFDLNLL